MTTKTVVSFVATDVTAESFFQTRRWILCIPDGPVQSVDSGVIAHSAFVKLVLTAQDVGLGNMCIAEHVKYRFSDGLFSVGHTIIALLAIARDLVGVWSGPESQSRMRAQDVVASGRVERVCHCGM